MQLYINKEWYLCISQAEYNEQTNWFDKVVYKLINTTSGIEWVEIERESENHLPKE